MKKGIASQTQPTGRLSQLISSSQRLFQFLNTILIVICTEILLRARMLNLPTTIY